MNSRKPMSKRTELDDDQKAAVLKLFRKSGTMVELMKKYMASFKVLEANTDSAGKDYYLMWCSVSQSTFKVPVDELMARVEKEE